MMYVEQFAHIKPVINSGSFSILPAHHTLVFLSPLDSWNNKSPQKITEELYPWVENQAPVS